MPQPPIIDLETARRRRTKNIDWGAVRARQQREDRDALVRAVSNLLDLTAENWDALQDVHVIVEIHRITCQELCAVGCDYALCENFARNVMSYTDEVQWLDDRLWVEL